ncbi:hypothetical protein FEF33_01345 [Moraxella osloensis]|jgi:urea transporter|uniref:CTP synthetase n=2 Tax=Moraxellaceae TaxID=468 RepID=A0A4P8UY05_FAUOS|nr:MULTISPECIES: hypothetical protein [Moraxella]MCG8147950.1 hypothetical protein [Moraxella tetraodonis]MDK1669518.1 hypothetical protein [Moraxella osloensis]QCR84680.1 hypothetical protein FEF33_01345 [Moraxella osloensis]QHG09716.1 hypothetical protein GSF12_07340 [Moraxella osloensis]WNP28220.1 hypothetical protein RNZ41_03795 [Moraxella sp. DOX410]
MNWQLFSVIFTIASGVTIGVLMTIALVTGFDQIPHIIATAIVGLILSIPIAWIVAKKMQTLNIAKTPVTPVAR